jgi:hypothetical protein
MAFLFSAQMLAHTVHEFAGQSSPPVRHETGHRSAQSCDQRFLPLETQESQQPEHCESKKNICYFYIFIFNIQKNRMVKFTAWAEILMDIVPYIITQSFQMVKSIDNI